MRFRKVSPAQWLRTPWKNGGGSTVQLAIYPQTSSLTEGNFVWRVSLATTNQSGPFSEFPGYDRVLASLSERPMVLRHGIDGGAEGGAERILRPLEPYYFRGEERTFCKLLDDEVRDLNAMIKRGQGSVEMHALELPPNARRRVGPTDCTIFFCVKGRGRFAFPGDKRKPVIHDDFSENTAFVVEASQPSEKLDIEVGPSGSTFLVTDFLLHLG